MTPHWDMGDDTPLPCSLQQHTTCCQLRLQCLGRICGGGTLRLPGQQPGGAIVCSICQRKAPGSLQMGGMAVCFLVLGSCCVAVSRVVPIILGGHRAGSRKGRGNRTGEGSAAGEAYASVALAQP
jgi:hypothetical protein